MPTGIQDIELEPTAVLISTTSTMPTFTSIRIKCYVFKKDRAVQQRKVALICPSLGFHIGAVKGA